MNVCENVCNIGEKAYKEYQIESNLFLNYSYVGLNEIIMVRH
jgi:hypothetical protein